MNDDKLLQILQESKTIAVVGLSRRQSRAGHYVPAYLQQQGYRIIPVNPYLKEETMGEKPYPDLRSVPDPVDLVLIFRQPDKVPPFVDQAIEIGARAVWMQLGIWHDEAAQKARNAGLQVVMDRCALVEHRRFRSLGLL